MSVEERLALLRVKIANRKISKSERREAPRPRESQEEVPSQDLGMDALGAKVAAIGRLLNEAKQKGNAARNEADKLKEKVAVLERNLWEARQYARGCEESYRRNLWVILGLVLGIGVLTFSVVFQWWTWL